MAEVTARIPLLLIEYLEAQKQWNPELIEDLSFTRSDLQERSNRRVDWDSFATFLERIAERCGGRSFLEQAAMTIGDDDSIGVLRALMRGLATAKTVYIMGARWWGAWLFFNTSATLEELEDGRLRETVTIDAPLRDCPEFFHLLLGALRTGPRLIGQGDAYIEMERRPRQAIYTITLPPKLGLLQRVRQLFAPGLSPQEALFELARQRDELQASNLAERVYGERLRRQHQRLQEEIAERRRAEQQLQQAQKMEVVGRLAGGIAHNFNNLLHVIRGYAQLLQSSLPPEGSHQQELETMVEATDRGAALVKQLMALSSRRLTHPQVVNLNETLRRMQPILSYLVGEDVQLLVSMAQELGSVHADPGELEQAIINLLTNARDAMPDGGRIEISTRNERLDDQDFVLLQVQDDGTGMDAETRARAFDPFFTTKPPELGTGLGLSTTYSMVTQHGGSIELESAPDRGTSVTIHLPRVDEVKEPPPVEAVHPRALTGVESILLVEDEPGVRAMTRRTLEAHGYRVVEAENGPSALELCASLPGPFDLLITDLVMPQMDGRELAKRVTAERAELRGVVFTTGYAEAELSARGALPQASLLLRKPYDAQSLLATMRQLLDAED